MSQGRQPRWMRSGLRALQLINVEVFRAGQ
jgi:hypothetical protein